MTYAEGAMIARIILWFIETLATVLPRVSVALKATFGAFRDGDVAAGAEHLENLLTFADDAIDNVAPLVFVSAPLNADAEKVRELTFANNLQRLAEAAKQLQTRAAAVGAEIGTSEARKAVQMQFDARQQAGTLPEGAPVPVPVA